MLTQVGDTALAKAKSRYCTDVILMLETVKMGEDGYTRELAH